MEQLIDELAKIRSCKFVSLKYRAKGTGELSKYLILTGVSLEKAYKRDHKVLRLIQTHDELEEQAKRELIDSLGESLKLGIGNNSAYTNKNTYITLWPGCRMHRQTREIFIYGWLVKKEVLEPGEYKEIHSKPLTIIKNEFRKKMKVSRFRTFSIGNIKTINLNNHFLYLE